MSTATVGLKVGRWRWRNLSVESNLTLQPVALMRGEQDPRLSALWGITSESGLEGLSTGLGPASDGSADRVEIGEIILVNHRRI